MSYDDKQDEDVKLSGHPLNKAFNIDTEGMDGDDDDDYNDIGFTKEELDLDEVIQQSRFIYNNLAGDLPYIDPKNKPMHYQMMERMLSEIKDAIWKKENIRLGREKFAHQKDKYLKSKSTDSDSPSDSQPSKGVDRGKLFSIK
jgi:hypothetical protein